jgi:hypothetical protein
MADVIVRLLRWSADLWRSEGERFLSSTELLAGRPNPDAQFEGIGPAYDPPWNAVVGVEDVDHDETDEGEAWRFLGDVYGEDAPGSIVVFSKPGGSKWTPAHDLATVAATVTRRARASDVYIGVGLYDWEHAQRIAAEHGQIPQSTRGTAQSVIAVPGIFFDLDVANAAHAETKLPTSMDAALDWLSRQALPPSLIVKSGHGLHVWWLFHNLWRFEGTGDWQRARDLSRGWQRMLRDSGAAHGWKFDNTSDLARLARVPGTINRKYEPVRVRRLNIEPERRYSIDELEAALVSASSTKGKRTRASQPSPELLVRLALEQIPEEGRNNAGFWLATQLRDHGWSQEETTAIMQAQYLPTVPPTNAYGMEEPYTEVEMLASIGQAYTREPREPWVDAQPDDLRVGEMLSDAPGNDLIVPAPYVLLEEATLRETTRKTGSDDEAQVDYATVAHAPVIITGRLRDINDGRESLRLVWKRADGWQSREVDRGEALNGRRLLEHATYGLPVASDNQRELVTYLHRFEWHNDRMLPTIRVTKRLGWQGDDGDQGFLIGHTHVLADGTIREVPRYRGRSVDDWPEGVIAFRGEGDGAEQIAEGFHTAGTWEGWRETISLIAPYPKVCLALYAALVPPLLEVLRTSNFTVDWANRTSTGKTTTLRVGASVWGNPDEAASDSILRSWNTTAVYTERASAILSGLPLLLDDTKLVKQTDNIASVIYMVEQGRGRGRGNIEGIDRSGVFRTVLLSSGESRATSFSQKGGTRTRVLEIVGAPFGATDDEMRRVVERLNRGLCAHYGHAGQRFMQYVLRHRERWDAWRARHTFHRERYAQAVKTPEGGRLANYAAAIAVAAEIAHEALDLPWELVDPLGSGLWEQVAGEAADAAGVERALIDVVNWAHANTGRFWVDKDEMKESPYNQRDLAGRWAAAYIGFFPHVLNTVLKENGYEPDAILAGWEERGWLDIAKGRKYDKQVRLEGSSRVYLIAIKTAAIAEVGA